METPHASIDPKPLAEHFAPRTGCFPGDSPGYPVTIDGQGGRSYRLTSDLIVPDENTDGIQVATSDLGIDLNNFSIIRSGCEGATVSCTPASGTGSGIERTSSSLRGISVKNGSITGMGSYGVVLGQQSEVTGVRVRWNRINGIDVRDGSTISGNTAYHNGDDGIFAWNGSTVSGNTTYNNSGDGIQTNAGCNVQHNTVQFNVGYGLNLGAYSLYLGNAVTLNSTGTVTGSGSANSGGGNYCSGTGTGSSSCP